MEECFIAADLRQLNDKLDKFAEPGLPDTGFYRMMLRSWEELPDFEYTSLADAVPRFAHKHIWLTLDTKVATYAGDKLKQTHLGATRNEAWIALRQAFMNHLKTDTPVDTYRVLSETGRICPAHVIIGQLPDHDDFPTTRNERSAIPALKFSIDNLTLVESYSVRGEKVYRNGARVQLP